MFSIAKLVRIIPILILAMLVPLSQAYPAMTEVLVYPVQEVPFNYGFVLLMVAMLCFFIEIAVSAFGLIGLVGVIAFVIGSVLLFNNPQPTFPLEWPLIFIMFFLSVGFLIIAVTVSVRAMRKKVVTGEDGLIGKTGIVSGCDEDGYQVRISGELWKARCDTLLQSGERVRVVQVTGLLLTVEPVTVGN